MPPFLFTAALLILTAGIASAQVNQTGRFGPLVNWPFIPVAIAHLPDGRVLGWSSTRPTTFPAGETFTYASVYDPLYRTRLFGHNFVQAAIA